MGDNVISFDAFRSQKTGRNDICPCGSGKKYKRCCGSNVAPVDALATTDSSDPSLKQWEALYEVAQNIRLLEPWNHLWESDLFTIMLPGRDEPVYCSVMGRAGECFAIGVYPGYASINSFYRLASSDVDELPFITGFEQDCLLCHFGNREEVSPEERAIYKKLGLKFRGRNEWIYFRSCKPGCIPWHINAGEADLLIQTLQNFTMALLPYLEGKFEVDFDEGETVLRFYSPEDELWYNAVEKMPPQPLVVASLIISDETLIRELKKHKKNGGHLEFDIAYMPMPIQENKKERPYLPQIVTLMDKDKAIPLDHQLIDKDSEIESEIIGMLVTYIENYGRPVSINVRDDRSGRYIEDLCKKISVKLIMGEGVPAVDAMLEGMMGFMD